MQPVPVPDESTPAVEAGHLTDDSSHAATAPFVRRTVIVSSFSKTLRERLVCCPLVLHPCVPSLHCTGPQARTMQNPADPQHDDASLEGLTFAIEDAAASGSGSVSGAEVSSSHADQQSSAVPSVVSPLASSDHSSVAAVLETPRPSRLQVTVPGDQFSSINVI